MPVDWRNPTGQTFQLAIGRLQALRPAERIGVLFVHIGGPGASGIDTYITGRNGAIDDNSPLRQYFDIVAFDQRGVGRSNPIVCSEELVAQTPRKLPASQAEYDALLAFNDALAKDCRKQTGPVFDHVDTVSAVRDIDAVRAALGEQQVSLWGISYGTQFWQQYAELYPNRIRAMVLDSNMDHSITSAFTFLKTLTEDQEAAFREFTNWCDKNSTCALHDRGALAVWDSVLAEAEAGELTDPSTGTALTAEALRYEMHLAMYRPGQRWHNFAKRLAALADGTSVPRTTTTVAAVENSYPGIWCSDWRWNVSGFAELESYRRQLEAIAPHTKRTALWEEDINYCLGWPGKVNNPQRPLAIKNTPPTLMSTSRYDASTPYAWNLAAKEQVPNSVLLQYDGASHNTFRNSPGCVRGFVEAYLIRLRLPRPGTHCPAEYPTQPPANAHDS